MNSSIPIDIRKACGIEEMVPASQAAVQKGKFLNRETLVSNYQFNPLINFEAS